MRKINSILVVGFCRLNSCQRSFLKSVSSTIEAIIKSLRQDNMTHLNDFVKIAFPDDLIYKINE